MDEVARSIRVSSTSHPLVAGLRMAALTIAGVIAAEGSFMATAGGAYRDGSPRKRFRFELTMAARDRAIVEATRGLLGYGCIGASAPRQRGWQPTVTLAIGSRRAHRASTIPVVDALLPACAKRDQFERWWRALDTYEASLPPRRERSICSTAGCSEPVRGRGLCRRHYYRATGY